MKNNVTIYIGDIKLNPDSHIFVEQYDDSILSSGLSFDSRVPMIDIDYLNLSKKDVNDIVQKAKRNIIICTLYPNKIDKKIPCQIQYKDGWIDESGEDLYEIVRQCFHQKDRKQLRNLLKDSRISTHFLNKWLHCNPTGANFDALKVLDYYIVTQNPDIWIDLVALLIHDGPDYPSYKYKRFNEG